MARLAHLKSLLCTCWVAPPLHIQWDVRRVCLHGHATLVATARYPQHVIMVVMPPNGSKGVSHAKVNAAIFRRSRFIGITASLAYASLKLRIDEPFTSNVPVTMEQPFALNGQQNLKR